MLRHLSLKLQLALSLILFSPFLWAHPGHDHAHWTSTVLHVLFYASIAAAAAACAFAIYKVVKRQSLTQGD